MIAVIHTGGKQYLVSPGQKLKVEKLDAEVGSDIDFENVLLIEDEKGKAQIGTPYLEGFSVSAKVCETALGEKKRVFKYKPKKRYSIKKGHRQPYTEVEIKEIGKKTAKKVTVKKEKED